MRLMSLDTAAGPVLAVEEGRLLRQVGDGLRDVGDLLLAHPDLMLEDAVDRAGRRGELPPAQPLLPLRPDEVWASGVTYERSRTARMAESQDQDVYSRVYDAERPELFFKATGPRVVGPGDAIGLRSDSTWLVPEPEIALVLGPGGRLRGVTIGNDVSSRDIEGENPLYLPQAKVFAGSCALGPAVVPVDRLDAYALDLRLTVSRDGLPVVEELTSTRHLHTTYDRLLEHLRRDNPLPRLTVLLTGTGVVPPDGFSLAPGDVVRIEVPGIGELVNACVRAADVTPPPGWSMPATATEGAPA